MMYMVINTREAEKEIDDVVFFYEQQRAGLGLDLLDVLEKARIRLSKNPQFHSFINHYKNFRSIAPHHFLYHLIYEIAGNIMIVLYLRHDRKNSFL